MASVASQMIEEVTTHAQSDILEDAREICADGTYFPNNLRTYQSEQRRLWSPGLFQAVSTDIQLQTLRQDLKQSEKGRRPGRLQTVLVMSIADDGSDTLLRNVGRYLPDHKT